MKMNKTLDKKQLFTEENFKFINRDLSSLSEEELFIDKNRYIDNLIREIKRNKLAFFSCTILIVVFLCSIFAFLSPYDPNKITISERLNPPSLKHLFGTDELGRDYFTRILYGGRVSLTVGFLSMIISVVIGTFVGTFSGFIGGKTDKLIMRCIDVLMCIPTFFLITSV